MKTVFHTYRTVAFEKYTDVVEVNKIIIPFCIKHFLAAVDTVIQ
jgi:hypothetical protein